MKNFNKNLFEIIINSKFNKNFEEEYGKNILDKMKLLLKVVSTEVIKLLEKENKIIELIRRVGSGLGETAKAFKDLSKKSKIITGIAIITSWIILLSLLLVYFIIRKYIKLKNQLSGYKSKEDKIAAITRMQKASRKANVFERMIDKGALYLVAKTEKSHKKDYKKTLEQLKSGTFFQTKK